MRYINFGQLRHKLGGRSRSSCYRDVELGRLPQPMKIGARLYWIEDEVDTLVQEQRVVTSEARDQ